MSVDTTSAKAASRNTAQPPQVCVASAECGDGWARFVLKHAGDSRGTERVESWRAAFDAAASIVTGWGLLDRPLMPDCALFPSNGGYLARVTTVRANEHIIVEYCDPHPISAAVHAWCKLFNFLACYRHSSPADSEAF